MVEERQICVVVGNDLNRSAKPVSGDSIGGSACGCDFARSSQSRHGHRLDWILRRVLEHQGSFAITGSRATGVLPSREKACETRHWRHPEIWPPRTDCSVDLEPPESLPGRILSRRKRGAAVPLRRCRNLEEALAVLTGCSSMTYRIAILLIVAWGWLAVSAVLCLVPRSSPELSLTEHPFPQPRNRPDQLF